MPNDPIELEYVNQLPSTLAELLATILNLSDTSPDHRKFVDAIIAVRTANAEGVADFDEGIKFKIAMNPAPNREAYYEAYIRYLGMTLYYHEQSQSDAAWYYYAQSKYYKGLFDTWEAVLFQMEVQVQRIAGKSKGGVNKANKQTGKMKDEFIKIIESPPAGGWKSRKQLLAVAIPLLQEFQQASGQALPLYENIPARASDWLRIDPRISTAFIKNSHDEYEAIYDIAEKSNDPNNC